jgi:hypothetical protein
MRTFETRNSKLETRNSKLETRVPSNGAFALDLNLYVLPAEAHPDAPMALSIPNSTCPGCEKARRLLELREIDCETIAQKLRESPQAVETA